MALRHWPAVATVAILAAAGFVFTRALDSRASFDEGVFLASLDALRNGQELGADVYTSQPPIFYWVLRTLAHPFGPSIPGIRFAFAVLAVGGVAAAVLLGWHLYGAAAGICTGALLLVGPPYPSSAHTVAADVPAVALGLLSLALVAVALRRGASRAWAVAGGAVYALAVLTKVLAAPFVVPFVALALAARAGARVLPSALLGAAAVTAVVAVVHAGALSEIWAAVVTDHTDADLGSYSENAQTIRRFLHPHTPFGWLVPAGFLAFLVFRRARRTWPLWTFVPAAMLFLVAVRPLLDHHMVLLAVAYVIAAGPSLAFAIGGLPRRPRLVAVVVLTLLVSAGVFQEQRRLRENDIAEPPDVSWAIEAIQWSTSKSAVVATDQPIVVFRARRTTPAALVDISNTRVGGGTLTPAEILREIDSADPDAVLVDRMLHSLPQVLAGLEDRYPIRVRCGDAVLYLRAQATTPPCPI